MKKYLPILAILLALGAYAFSYYEAKPAAPTLGAYNPAAAGTYRLQSSLSSSATSLTLTSFKEPVSGNKYTMSYFNSTIEYATLEPQTSNREFISFTGVTQNSDGSATLTGVSRGLSGAYPYTASSTLELAHPAQSIFILSNPPQLTNNYANKNNSETISGTWTFGHATPPQYDANYTASGNQFVSFSQLNATAIKGGATSTEGVLGYVALDAASNLANGTASTSSGAPLVIQNKFATTTPGKLCTGGTWKCIVAAVSGKISQTWLDLTAAFTFSGTVTFSGTTNNTGSAYGFANIYGDGSDSASTTAASFTLTRDYYFTDYTISSGDTINTGGHRIFVTGTLTINGTLAANGGNGGNGTQGTDQSSTGNGAGGAGGSAGAAAYTTGTLPAGPAGTAGGAGSNGVTTSVTAGTSKVGSNASYSFTGVSGSAGGSGGQGGNATCGSGTNSGGTSTAGSATQVEKPNQPLRAITPVIATSSPANALQLAAQSAGGGGGGGACSNAPSPANAGGGGGGGGGGSGGYILIVGKTVTVSASGSITANGGNGGNGGRGGNATGGTNNIGGGGGGAGSGGAGGLIVIIYSNSYTNNGTVTASGGSAGTAGAAGTGATASGFAGSSGNAGNSGVVKTMRI